MKKRTSSRRRKLNDILSRYIRILNKDGADSEKEVAFRNRHADDPGVLRLLHGARAVKALFELHGDFPDVRPEGRRHKMKNGQEAQQ